MAMDLARHPYFRAWKDPVSGAESFILHERVAPLQKHLYYTTPSISADGRWLWFYAAFPPARHWHLAVCCLDPDEPMIRHFPHVVPSANPRIIEDGRKVYVAVGDAIWTCDIEGNLEQVLRMPRELVGGRHLFRLLTTITISADGRYFVLDSEIGNRWLISLGEIATGKVIPLRWFSGSHHHAMFSPVDPELFMMGQGPWHDRITGDKFDMNIRMWIMDTKQTRYEPVLPDLWYGHNCMSCHEWWARDGVICWCEYEEGVYEVDLADRQKRLVWAHPAFHADCDAKRELFVLDENPYARNERKTCKVFFFDRRSGKEVAIASDLPYPTPRPVMQSQDWRTYHLDPHPQFSPDDRQIVYCTTCNDTVDLAIAPVEGLLAATR